MRFSRQRIQLAAIFECRREMVIALEGMLRTATGRLATGAVRCDPRQLGPGTGVLPTPTTVPV